MGAYLIIALAGFVALFIVKSLRNIFFNLAKHSVSLLNDLLTAEDDEVKLALLQKSTNKLVVSLLYAIGIILLALVAFWLPLEVYEYFGTDSIKLNLGSWQSIVALSIGASIPFILPSKKKVTEGYSELSQLLHRLALNNYTLAYKLFKREVKQRKENLVRNEKFLTVTGLARAGTTSLLNTLNESGQFSSLGYNNMPFLMSPNTWKKVYNPKGGEAKERSHKDGIKIGLDSTEALEEFFFKVVSNDAFIEEESLKEYTLSDQDYDDYLDYQGLIRKNEQSIYLAKNNNFILRYRSLREKNSQFVMALLFRHPLYHAASLLEKHLDYCELQEKDEFVLEYMDWLGHHEFGLNQKVFQFDDTDIKTKDKTSLNYWLEIWLNYYRHALSINDSKTIFVSYEQYCNSPGEVLQNVANSLEMDLSSDDIKGHHNERKVQGIYSE
ncbi:MAG: hypothetical protein N4A46_04360, partial [Schleiferiaceae bacterium]|nr:hypothetical protein [Schleiferiaceae bacterium]